MSFYFLEPVLIRTSYMCLIPFTYLLTRFSVFWALQVQSFLKDNVFQKICTWHLCLVFISVKVWSFVWNNQEIESSIWYIAMFKYKILVEGCAEGIVLKNSHAIFISNLNKILLNILLKYSKIVIYTWKCTFYFMHILILIVGILFILMKNKKLIFKNNIFYHCH